MDPFRLSIMKLHKGFLYVVIVWKGEMKMEKKQFKAESKRLLEMMINSIYTQKRGIFKRVNFQCQ